MTPSGGGGRIENFINALCTLRAGNKFCSMAKKHQETAKLWVTRLVSLASSEEAGKRKVVKNQRKSGEGKGKDRSGRETERRVRESGF